MTWRASAIAGVVLAAGAALGLGAAPAKAASILVGQGDTTLDPGTGLEWLDLSATAGQSYNAVVGGFGGYIGSGWRFATGAEVAQLYDDAGGGGSYPVNTSSNSYSANYAAALTLTFLLGGLEVNSFDSGVETYSWGLLADSAQSGTHTLATFATGTGAGYFFAALDAGGFDFAADDMAAWNRGAFLVRSTLATTPIPAALPLFLTALAGFGFMGRRRRAQAAL